MLDLVSKVGGETVTAVHKILQKKKKKMHPIFMIIPEFVRFPQSFSMGVWWSAALQASQLHCNTVTRKLESYNVILYSPVQNSCLLLCTTQNGHLVVWQVLEPAQGEDSDHKYKPLQRLWKGKLHLGSVEGLTWHHQTGCGGGSIATVGADCIVHLFNIVTWIDLSRQNV